MEVFKSLLFVCLLSLVIADEDKCGLGAYRRNAKVRSSQLAMHPWVVSLGYYKSNGNTKTWQHTCGGAIVSKRIIITAANCFDEIDRDLYFPEQPAEIPELPVSPEYSDEDDSSEEETELVTTVLPLIKPRLQIKMGDDALFTETDDKFAKIYHPDSAKFHPKAEKFGFDVALIALNETIEFNDQIHKVCLPEKSVEDGDEKAEWNTDLTPWDESTGTLITNLKGDQIGYASDCNKVYEHQSHQICIENHSCKNYPGTPLTFHDGKSTTIYGIMSGSEPTCENAAIDNQKLGILTRLEHPEVFNWIKEMKEELELCVKLKDCFCELKKLRC